MLLSWQSAAVQASPTGNILDIASMSCLSTLVLFQIGGAGAVQIAAWHLRTSGGDFGPSVPRRVDL